MVKLFLKKRERDDLILAIDVGSYKTCAVLARLSEKNFEIVNFSCCNSRGIKKGKLVDQEALLTSLKTVIEGLGICKDTDIILSVPSVYTTSFTKNFSIPIKKNHVSKEHISKLINTAHVNLSNYQMDLIHLIPMSYCVDGGSPVKNPLNLEGNILEMQAMIIVSPKQKGIDKLLSVCERAGINITYLILSQLSTSSSTITDEERDRGVLLVDIGGGKTEVSVFKYGTLRFFSSIPIGGNHFTNDLSVVLGLPFNECERIKKIYSEVYLDYNSESQIEVLSYDGTIKTVISKEIFSIINPRAEELLLLIQREIQNYCVDEPLVCAILTGGVANMSGLSSLAENVFEMPVRIGTATALHDDKNDIITNMQYASNDLIKPEFTCVVGTALHGLNLLKDEDNKKKKTLFKWFKKKIN